MREVQSCAYYPFVPNTESTETEERGAGKRAGKRRRKSHGGAEETCPDEEQHLLYSYAYMSVHAHGGLMPLLLLKKGAGNKATSTCV